MKRSPDDPRINNPADGFLGRWARRKQEQVEVVETEVLQEDIVDGTRQLTQPGSEGELESVETDEELQLAPSDEEQVLTDEDMPPLESLNADSDYSPFFSEGVSKQLRNLALKRLFFSGKFAARDGLDDYDDDFTKFEPLGDTITSDMRYHERRKEKARLAKLEEEQQALAEQRAEEEQAQEEQAQQEADEQEAAAQQDPAQEDMDGQAGAPDSPDGSDPADEAELPVDPQDGSGILLTQTDEPSMSSGKAAGPLSGSENNHSSKGHNA